MTYVNVKVQITHIKIKNVSVYLPRLVQTVILSFCFVDINVRTDLAV